MIPRRRVLSILAGAAMLPAFGAKASPQMSQWRGIALGAEARIILDHPNADALLASAVSEIERLERIFSLYQTDSQISRLNRDGELEQPAFELIELLSICSRLNSRTNGAFDPTVQPLWALYAEGVSAGNTVGEARISQALAKTGWRLVRYTSQMVAFDRPGMGVTLNGIAQGYIADKITQLFRRNGVQDVLVNTGEIVASGHGPDHDGWPVHPGRQAAAPVQLRNAAIATSAPLGTTFDGAGRQGHILDPRTGRPGGNWSEVTVIASSAAEADGLSTGFCLMDAAEIAKAKGQNQVFLRA